MDWESIEMNLHKELYCHQLGYYMYLYCKEIKDSINDKLEGTALKALDEIRTVIRNTAMSDFEIVDEIVTILNKYGISTGGQHDF